MCAITRSAIGDASNFFFDRLWPNRRDDLFSPIHHIRFYFTPTSVQQSRSTTHSKHIISQRLRSTDSIAIAQAETRRVEVDAVLA